jgi:putative SOS response-associated peptidase YedK
VLEPNEDVALEIYPVERFVNDVRRDGPELVLRRDDPRGPVAPTAGTLGL